jgi:hypothetical protein
MFDVLCFTNQPSPVFGIQSGLQQKRRHAVHHQREPLHLSGAGVQRCRRGRRAEAVHQEPQDGVVPDDAQLGAGVGLQWRPQEHGGATPLLPRSHQRRPLRHLPQRRPCKLALRPNFPRKKLPNKPFTLDPVGYLSANLNNISPFMDLTE